MINTWDEMKWWGSGEWQVCYERLDELDDRFVSYNPERKSLFRALWLTPFDRCRVAIIGQDPYPQKKFTSGVAFSIPKSLRKYPPTLEMIYGELWDDLKIKRKNGCLESWCSQGILLWNAIPTCSTGRSMSHDWPEWSYLTSEIIRSLTEKGVVFAFLGGVARRYASLVQGDNNAIIETGHPSPRGNLSARNPFTGSRLFSTINDKLTNLGLSPIDWSK